MVLSSVDTPVNRRNQRPNHFSLDTGDWAWAMHQLDVQLVMQFQEAAMNAVNAQDVIVVGNTIGFGNQLRRQVFYECHKSPYDWLYETVYHAPGNRLSNTSG